MALFQLQLQEGKSVHHFGPDRDLNVEQLDLLSTRRIAMSRCSRLNSFQHKMTWMTKLLTRFVINQIVMMVSKLNQEEAKI